MLDVHFPRPELAKKALDTFDVGLASRLSIVAQRRKGKTAFLLKDIAPESIKRKYVPIYISLWQEKEQPHMAIIHALEVAKQNLGKRGAISRLLTAQIKKASISNELLGNLQVEFASHPAPASSRDLLYIDELVDEIDKGIGKRKHALLLIDEIQHLATSEAFSGLSHALRTSLDKRQGKVKSIFTGSSRHHMSLLFNNPGSPFFSFCDALPFPDLGSEFLVFIQSYVKKTYGRELDLNGLIDIWERVDKSPFWMIRAVNRVLLAEESIKEATEYTLLLLEESQGFEVIAKKMRPADKIVFRAIAEGRSPYSVEVLAEIGANTKVKGSKSNVQKSLERMLDLNLISQYERRKYHVEMPGLKGYLERYF